MFFEKFEFEFWDKSILEPLFWKIRTIRIMTKKIKTTVFYIRASSSSLKVLIDILRGEMKPVVFEKFEYECLEIIRKS